MALLSGEALLLLAILTVIPGPDTFLTLRQGLAGGLRLAVPTIAGISLGLVVHASLAGLGLAFLLRESPAAYRALQFAGVGYLAYVGVRSLLAAWRPPPPPDAALAAPPLRHAFRDGLLTNLLNPKVALFYLGFLPQFLPQGASLFGVAVLYGLAHAIMGEVQLGVVAIAADALRQRVTSPSFRRGADVVAGVAFLAFSLRLALTG